MMKKPHWALLALAALLAVMPFHDRPKPPSKPYEKPRWNPQPKWPAPLRNRQLLGGVIAEPTTRTRLLTDDFGAQMDDGWKHPPATNHNNVSQSSADSGAN
jgi:hypothetical protein